eukprot:4711940-Amphidinium_carterae.1
MHFVAREVVLHPVLTHQHILKLWEKFNDCDTCEAGTPPHAKNSKGQMAVELCADNSTFEVTSNIETLFVPLKICACNSKALHSFERHNEQLSGRPWEYQKDFAENEEP